MCELKNIIIYSNTIKDRDKEFQDFVKKVTRFNLVIADSNEFMAPDCMDTDDSIIIACDVDIVNTYADRGYAVAQYCAVRESIVGEFSRAGIVIESLEGIDGEFLVRTFQRKHGIPWKIFETKRCIVREMTVEDLPELYDIYKAESVSRFVEALYKDYEEELEFTRAYINNMYKFYGFGLWIIEDRKGIIIGRAGISLRENESDAEYELGYIIREERQNQGYGFEVCKAIVEYSFEELKCEHIIALIDKQNINSVRLAKKLGMIYEGNICVKDETLGRYVIVNEKK